MFLLFGLARIEKACPLFWVNFAYEQDLSTKDNFLQCKARVKCAFGGFRLIELLVVLIIGTLAVTALPQYERAVEKSRAAEAVVLVGTIGDAEKRYYMSTDEYADDFGVLAVSFPATPLTYQGTRGFQTKNFFCRPACRADTSGCWLGTLATCQRLPINTTYAISYLNDGNIVCRYYNDEGKIFAKHLEHITAAILCYKKPLVRERLFKCLTAHTPDSVSCLYSRESHYSKRPTLPLTRDTYGHIWPCSMRGLPCRTRYLVRGALLPHLFTLARRRFVFCGTFRTRGFYPACPLLSQGAFPCGVRKFLLKRLS